jgi:hypothetical protein
MSGFYKHQSRNCSSTSVAFRFAEGACLAQYVPPGAAFFGQVTCHMQPPTSFMNSLMFINGQTMPWSPRITPTGTVCRMAPFLLRK